VRAFFAYVLFREAYFPLLRQGSPLSLGPLCSFPLADLYSRSPRRQDRLSFLVEWSFPSPQEGVVSGNSALHSTVVYVICKHFGLFFRPSLFLPKQGAILSFVIFLPTPPSLFRSQSRFEVLGLRVQDPPWGKHLPRCFFFLIASD